MSLYSRLRERLHGPETGWISTYREDLQAAANGNLIKTFSCTFPEHRKDFMAVAFGKAEKEIKIFPDGKDMELLSGDDDICSHLEVFLRKGKDHSLKVVFKSAMQGTDSAHGGVIGLRHEFPEQCRFRIAHPADSDVSQSFMIIDDGIYEFNDGDNVVCGFNNLAIGKNLSRQFQIIYARGSNLTAEI